MINFDIIINIFYFGKYFNPADSHYYPGAIVKCDRCDKINIPISVGYENHDLCLDCIKDISSQIRESKSV